MKSLYESILSSTNTGRTAYIKSILNKPADNIDKINELWKSLGLSYDNGFGEGKWDYFTEGYIVYYLPTDDKGHVDDFAMMGKNLTIGTTLITFALRGKPKEEIDNVKEYAEKVAKALKMKISTDKFNIYLKF